MDILPQLLPPKTDPMWFSFPKNLHSILSVLQQQIQPVSYEAPVPLGCEVAKSREEDDLPIDDDDDDDEPDAHLDSLSTLHRSFGRQPTPILPVDDFEVSIGDSVSWFAPIRAEEEEGSLDGLLQFSGEEESVDGMLQFSDEES